MKLSKFDTVTNANAGIEVELTDIATGKGTGAFIKVLGTDSDVFKRVNAERARNVVERMRARDGKELDREEIDIESCELLAKCTLGWRGLEGEDGEPHPFSQAAARDLYLGYPAIKEQVDSAIADRARFIKG